MPLNAQILLSILAHETSSGDLSRSIRVTPANYALSLVNGTGANQANLVWSNAATFDGVYRPLGLGFSFDSVTDDRGSGSFSAIKFIYIKNTGEIEFSCLLTSDWPGGPVFSAAAGGLQLQPGGAVAYFAPTADGYPTAGSRLAFEVDGGVSSYEVVLIGEGTIS